MSYLLWGDALKEWGKIQNKQTKNCANFSKMSNTRKRKLQSMEDKSWKSIIEKQSHRKLSTLPPKMRVVLIQTIVIQNNFALLSLLVSKRYQLLQLHLKFSSCSAFFKLSWLFSYAWITVRNNWVSTRPCLCSKSSIFKTPWQILKAATLKPSWPIYTISESFLKRYCMILQGPPYILGHF